ncbi:isoprenylcysteine carboxyl methyltransferase [Alkalihalobacillus alcalophilus ATCC 27647 = CGMCC 1.3604]|uniref:Isoprenylcysteine carboxyl methyltransferase n=1 Tax=Alkalihalobacillus alcalophilus ATCC 27647 = CGMCC 1.3604 TaxID=1218173 RepID=A0A4S4JXE4_ALKAL|nr:isoprenylcysteine carboxyl methyltransferase family protein [Alkalihalobacillus alcalophilus]MED1562273.1 isoprenylcysteine carboxyl methyltransferase family protein [Alkalihalobacillus alcalophilus]THG89410.1 isoprenylcysteine carboxyl methyltransferase [Alkalihalobacillus alcalophilus ATCC 27647 = CGMCC 1.3604]
MSIWIYIFLGSVMLQRVLELIIANRNKRWIEDQGGFEVGKEHYPFLVLLHVGFFLSLFSEIAVTQPEMMKWTAIPFCLFIIAQVVRVWALSSLGRFWNTRIMILPGARVVTKGPYHFMRHPNYMVVAVEIISLPIIFQAYWTAFLFTVLNGVVLSIRIKEEERALQADTNYNEIFENKSRFIPSSDD